ncbi:MAG TPA: imelysin family protein [Niastella sp.]
MKKFSLVFVLLAASLATMYSCSKSSKGSDDGDTTNGFDKSAMLTNYAESLIIPGYTALQEKLALFQTAADAFLTTPTTTTQDAAKIAYTALYLQYERTAVYQVGPAETELLDNFLNYTGGLDYNFNTSGAITGFSVDSTSIESNISSGTYNLATMLRSSFYSQGFPALGYLLFGPNAIAKFNTNTAARVKYTRDVVARMKTLVDKVAAAWPAYKATFTANTKTNVGSPIGSLVNQFAYQLDLMKGPRIGWPFGKQSNGIVFASKTEGYFAGISAQLAVENLTSLKKAYTAAGSGKGISDYLIALNRASLNNDITTQFDVAIAKLKLIPDPLSNTLTAQPSLVEDAYKEVQKLLTLLKTDLASATAVQISYMDNDGD